MSNRQEYNKAYYQANKDKRKAYYQANKDKCKAYYQANKDKCKARREANIEHYRAYQKAYHKVYNRSDVNSLGQTKTSIRQKSWRYLKKYGTKIPGYQIHHCCTYTEPYKFIYCSKEMHRLIHAYLRQHNIDADSDHYDLIKHLLDDRVVLYGIES